MLIDPAIHDALYYIEALTHRAHCERAKAGGFKPLTKYQFNIVVDDIVEQEIAVCWDLNLTAFVK